MLPSEAFCTVSAVPGICNNRIRETRPYRLLLEPYQGSPRRGAVLKVLRFLDVIYRIVSLTKLREISTRLQMFSDNSVGP